MPVPNYSTEGLAERAKKALADRQDYVQALERSYVRMTVRRVEELIPTLAILGMGRAGKDTAGEFLSNEFGLVPAYSSSLCALPMVAHMIGLPDEEAYAERHQHRKFWIEACNQLRADDLTRLARWCLGKCDTAIGLRGKTEFAACVRERMFDLSVWVDNNRVENDITVEFSRADCDVVIDNHTSLERYHAKLLRFGRTVYRRIPKSELL